MHSRTKRRIYKYLELRNTRSIVGSLAAFALHCSDLWDMLFLYTPERIALAASARVSMYGDSKYDVHIREKKLADLE